MNIFRTSVLLFICTYPVFARTVVFWQEGFPTIASQPISRPALVRALDSPDVVFTGIDGLRDPTILGSADLLVLPYGSATPTDAWSSILGYLRGGGNILVLGGQAFRAPVTAAAGGGFRAAPPQDVYARDVGILHSYELPPFHGAEFGWRTGYSFLRTPGIRARRFFALEGRLNGLGYMTSEGVEWAAPVVVVDRAGSEHAEPDPKDEDPMRGSRTVMLDFEPENGYWESADGVILVHEAAAYARRGATILKLELAQCALKRGETPQISVHVRNARRQRLGLPQTGEVKIELLSGSAVLETARVGLSGGTLGPVEFRQPLGPGFYTVRGVYEDDGLPRESYQNGFWVEDEKLLRSGSVLGVKGNFLTRDGKPYFPVGTNHFSTEEDKWDFSGPQNAWVWERDFANMERRGVTFVRTGVWTSRLSFLDPATGAAPERFLRNLEAYLLSARRHGMIVNFTFYAFAPRPGMGPNGQMPIPGQPLPAGPGSPPAIEANPYLDPTSIRAEENYMLSVVNRFKDLPWLCWDLINEPSFSNPGRLWKGNTPNGDPVEIAAWRLWLSKKYGRLEELAAAWSVSPEQLESFESVPLPSQEDLVFSRYGNDRQVRAVDYNLFAQDLFARWVQTMVTAIRGTGSRQLVDVGQDEGGVMDRVLNQFYAAAGVSFTTNHSYWRDDSLLWDSVVAKRQGIPNIIGETGFQPVWSADGAWRYDEITGRPILERKLALGFAAGNGGAMQWDWGRDVDFGMERSDGSAKSWQTMIREMAQFAEKAAPWADGPVAPEVALILPQSLQLSVLNPTALEAQQKSVRALYQYARSEAYAVGEYQIELLGNPKLIILPSPLGLTPEAWLAIRRKVESGATLLVSGVFDGDSHFHPTARQREIGLTYQWAPITIRENSLRWPGGEAPLVYGADKTTYLERAVLPDSAAWAEKGVGKGKVLFAALPLEWNDRIDSIGSVYRYALKAAGIAPTYSTTLEDPGILICPTKFPHATLYVLTSESERREVSFLDQRSGKQFSGLLDPGRAALLLIGERGELLAEYNWRQQ